MTDGWFPKSTQHVFSKARKRIVDRVKRSESPSVQGPQSSEEDLVVWTRFHKPGSKTLKMAPMSQRRVDMGYVKGYSIQVGLNMNIKNDLRSLQFHIVGVALDLAWEGKILGLESKDKIQPVSQWSWWYIILCCEKHRPRYRNLDKADPVNKLKD